MLPLPIWFNNSNVVQIKARSAGNGITVDLSQMRSVVVDPVKQTASVQGNFTSVWACQLHKSGCP